MQRLMNRDVICAAVLMFFSVGAWVQAIELSPRSALFPRLVISLLLIFSLVYLLRSLWRTSDAQQVAPFFANGVRFGLALVLIGAYVAIFPRVGFFTTTFIFIPIFSVAIGLRKIAGILVGSAIFSIGAWLVFVVLLSRRLPPEVWLSALSGGGM